MCPYHQPAPHSADPAWQPRPGLDLPSLVELQQRTDDEWRAVLRGSPMKRAKLEGLRRNIESAARNREAIR